MNGNEYPEKSLYRQGVNVKTNSITDAPIAEGKTRFPVLVYQPGGGTARFIGTFQAEQLASRGYVVVGADHPGFSETMGFPDGYQFKADNMLAPKETGNFREDVLKNWDWLGNEVLPTWIADATYTLDKIAELDRTTGQLFHKRLDLSRIGMMGWSFGGATAMQMSRVDPRVKAVVDQDGQLFGEVRDKGTSRPFMLMHHGLEDKPPKPEQSDVMKEMTAKTNEWDRSLIEHSTHERVRHAAGDAPARDLGHVAHLLASESTMRIAPAVTKMLSSAISTSHFQAKPISWSMRTRGSVPRIHTKMNAKVNVLSMNQNRPTMTSKLMERPERADADGEHVEQHEGDDQRHQEHQLLLSIHRTNAMTQDQQRHAEHDQPTAARCRG